MVVRGLVRRVVRGVVRRVVRRVGQWVVRGVGVSFFIYRTLVHEVG